MAKPFYDNYRYQKYAADKRGIDWNFTYDTWIEWWGSDIENRGKCRGQLCMARAGDVGPYHPDNVRKAFVEENASESNKGVTRSEEHKRQISIANKGKTLSESTRLKISATKKEMFAQQRQENTI